MKTCQVVLLLVFISCFGYFNCQVNRGLLPIISALDRIRKPIHDRIHTVAHGVHNILDSARDTIHKLTAPAGTGLNPDLHDSTNLNDGRPQSALNNYPQYETSISQILEETEHDNHQEQKADGDGDILMYTKDNFPIFSLKENEIRRK